MPIYTPFVDASIDSEESATAVLHLTLSRHSIHTYVPVLASLLATKVTTRGGKLSCKTCLSQQSGGSTAKQMECAYDVYQLQRIAAVHALHSTAGLSGLLT